ncbi:hypothetical protein [Sediminimonas sp.]|uniref:hypothetical protein n=1 Tax=Sediminimonas sp. TaxID=2823379 RepID=UPI0025D73960|nr:hypothetical protein [Sediminimonas sp.]
MTRKTDGKTPPAAGASREDRLKAALKANMARRKAQARARGAKPAPADDPGAERAGTNNDKGQG